MDTDKDTVKDMDKNKARDTDMKLEYFWKIYIWRYSRYSAIWITCYTSERNFQQR
jgi:hypothetical protein